MISNKKWFTLMEVMVIVVLIALWLITVIEALKNSSTYLQKTRQKIIAINLAREGVEQMMNIRNTNRQKRAWEKEKTRLKTNPSLDEGGDGLSNDPWFWSGNYIILTTTVNNQQFFYGSGISQPLIIENWTNNTWNKQYSLCETWWSWSACPWQIPKSKEGSFFRKIQWFGVFKKESATQWGTFTACPNWTTCWDETAKEFRFCSTVEYINNGFWKVELCSVLTNFEK